MLSALPSPTPRESRAIDLGLAHWVMARTGSRPLADAVRAASCAEGEGHACARLATDGAEDRDLPAIAGHPWVGRGEAFTPFVLDAGGRFYLWRNWQHETTLAAHIRRRCTARIAVDPAPLAADLERLFAGMPAAPSASQRAAVACAPGKRFLVLTGGPGTGKTTTVVRMLLMLLRHAAAAGLPAQPSIALAAPTGKAAQRLAQAIAAGKAALHTGLAGTADGAPAPGPAETAVAGTDWPTALAAIPHASATTLHRLLGYRPHLNDFAHGAQQPLAEDIVVVDEASMVDLALMRQLLDALRPEALLILVGDPGQLASVEAGSVLADIVAAAGTHPLLAQHVAALDYSWRTGGALKDAIDALRDTPDPTDDPLAATGGLALHHCASSRDLDTQLKRWIERHRETLRRLLTTPLEAAEALELLRNMQILCALREGPFGAAGINTRQAQLLAEHFGVASTATWYPGRPVIITRNDDARGLANGDIGIALAGSGPLRVWFEHATREGGTTWRSHSPRALPAHASAWAITVHRSQGSEYRDVAVVLPPDPEQPLATRELVYTGVSRARQHAELWTTEPALRAALHRPVTRLGGLREKLGGT